MIHDQTQAFLDGNKILYRFQSGFRKHFFFRVHTGTILIDLQKAFDTINQEILINKMKFLKFYKDVILWFKSYLSCRKFKVNLNKSFSKPG